MSKDVFTNESRFPALTPMKGNLDAPQAVEYDYLVDITQKVYGDTIITKDPDGSLQGPFGQILLEHSSSLPLQVWVQTVVHPWAFDLSAPKIRLLIGYTDIHQM
jgi:hypothetical protein